LREFYRLTSGGRVGRGAAGGPDRAGQCGGDRWVSWAEWPREA